MLAAGSRGDYQPVVAVGRALAARGHDVGVTATSDYVDLVRAGGLRAEEVRMDLMSRYREDVLSGPGMPGELKAQLAMVGEMARVLAPEVTRTLRDLSPRYDGFVTTALTATWPGLFLPAPRRRQVLMMFVPALPSVWGDSSLFSVQAGRSWHNLAAGLRALGSARGAIAPGGPDAAGVDVGVRARARASLQMMTAPAFVAMTPQLVTPRRVGGRNVRVVGYPVAPPEPAGADRPGHADSSLPAEVEDFLAAGSPPVFVGLGSHTLPAVREALRAVVGAALSLGHRVLVQRGSGLEDEGGHDARVAFVGDVPHELLLPRTAAVVSHAGAGTSVDRAAGRAAPGARPLHDGPAVPGPPAARDRGGRRAGPRGRRGRAGRA